MWHRHVIILANIWSNDRNACQSCLKYKYVWIQEHFTFSWENALSVELGSSSNLNFKLPPFRVLSRPRKCCEYQDFLILDSTILDFVLRGPQVSCNSPWRRILWIKFDWETLLKIFCPLSVVRPRYTKLRYFFSHFTLEAAESFNQETLPKAQRTRGLSSYHNFLHKSWSNFNFRLSTKH